MRGAGTYVLLAAVLSEQLERDEPVRAAALAIRERAEYTPVQLPESDERLRLGGAPHAHLPESRNVLPTRRIRVRRVARWAGAHGQRSPTEQERGACCGCPRDARRPAAHVATAATTGGGCE